MKRPLIAVMLTVLTGCPEERNHNVTLYQRTGAPPTLQADLEQGEDGAIGTIRLSRGVAMAVACWDSCPSAELNCEHVTVAVDETNIITVHPVYDPYGEDDTFVLSGATSGATNVTVTTRCGSKQYRAVVE